MGLSCVRCNHIITLSTRGAICSAMTLPALTKEQMYQNTESVVVDFCQYMAF